MHDAAAQNDFLRGQDHDVVHQGLGDVRALQLPNLGTVHQLHGLFTPAALNGRTAGKALQAVGMIGADTAFRILGMPGQQNVASLGVQHAMQQFSARADAHAHAGADGYVDGAVKPLGTAVGHLPQTGTVHIRVQAHRHVQLFFQSPQKVKVAPGQLGRVQNPAVGGGLGLHVHRAKGRNPQGFYVLVLKIAHDLLHRLLRRGGGDGYLLQNCSVFISQGADHLGAARLQCSDQHMASSL